MCNNTRNSCWIAFGILILFVEISKSQNPPSIACPNVFQYMSYGNNYIGKVTLSNLPLAPTIVEVEFSQREPITTSFNGKLSLNQDLPTTQSQLEKGQPISYRVDFPNPNILPKLTAIKVGGTTICSDQGYSPPRTSFKLQHSFLPARPTTFSQTTDPDTIIKRLKTNDGFEITYSLAPTTTVIRHSPSFSSNPSSTSSSDTPIISYSENNPFINHLLQMQNPVIQRIPLNISPNNGGSSQPQSKPVWTVARPVYSSSGQSTNVGCGREGLTPFVVGGGDFPRGKFPWLAAIYLRVLADLKFTCGGSLISSRTVITAAHCFQSKTYSPNLISVALGRHNLFISEEGSIQRDVETLTIHPNYNTSAISDADIALLQMSAPVEFTQYVRPICLWTQSSELSLIENRNGFVAGWGSDNNGNAVSSAAKMVSAKIVSESECLRSSELFRILTSSRTICAGNRDGTGPCVGDSGGGLMLDVNGLWTLRGILSAGQTFQRDCDLKEFVVYCDVAKHITWIHQNMLT